ncbi:hypothetical protein AB4383_02935 [Vibrio breoganii]
MKMLIEFIQNEEGLTVVSYVVAAALLVGTVVAVFVALTELLPESFQRSLDEV